MFDMATSLLPTVLESSSFYQDNIEMREMLSNLNRIEIKRNDLLVGQ